MLLRTRDENAKMVGTEWCCYVRVTRLRAAPQTACMSCPLLLSSSRRPLLSNSAMVQQHVQLRCGLDGTVLCDIE